MGCDERTENARKYIAGAGRCEPRGGGPMPEDLARGSRDEASSSLEQYGHAKMSGEDRGPLFGRPFFGARRVEPRRGPQGAELASVRGHDHRSSGTLRCDQPERPGIDDDRCGAGEQGKQRLVLAEASCSRIGAAADKPRVAAGTILAEIPRKHSLRANREDCRRG